MDTKGQRLHSKEVARIYYEHGEAVGRFLMSLCRNQDDANDLLQIVFLKLIERVKNGTIYKRNIKAYLFRIAYYAFVDRYKAEIRQDEILPGFIEKLQTHLAYHSRDVDPERQKQLFSKTKTILEESVFTDKQKAILALRFYEHLSVAKIAKVLKMAERTVHRELRLLLDRLRKVFEEAGISPENLGFQVLENYDA